jgi:hypothetical protein
MNDLVDLEFAKFRRNTLFKPASYTANIKLSNSSIHIPYQKTNSHSQRPKIQTKKPLIPSIPNPPIPNFNRSFSLRHNRAIDDLHNPLRPTALPHIQPSLRRMRQNVTPNRFRHRHSHAHRAGGVGPGEFYFCGNFFWIFFSNVNVTLASYQIFLSYQSDLILDFWSLSFNFHFIEVLLDLSLSSFHCTLISPQHLSLHNLIRQHDSNPKHIGELLQLIQDLIQALLALAQFAATGEIGAEASHNRIHHDQGEFRLGLDLEYLI